MAVKMIIDDGGFGSHLRLLEERIAERVDAKFEHLAGVDAARCGDASQDDLAGEALSLRLMEDRTFAGAESYRIDGSGFSWTICGSDELGLYYGIGKFLHSALWNEEGFVPQPTDGWVIPDCDFRCIYFSVHFHNWYHEAPIREVEDYLKDMLLYGYNAIECIVPIVQLSSFEDPMFRDSVEKVRTIFSLAKKLGMKVLFSVVPNQGMVTAPHEWDADLSYDREGIYRGWLGRNLCPSKPGVIEYLRGIWLGAMEQFLDIGLDYMIAWPYDEGGCGCAKCAPWGAGGFEKLCRVLSRDLKRLYPGAKLIYSTWTFDVPDDQCEYSTLYRRLADGDMDYVDYLMTDAHGDYPRYVLEHPVIKPIVNFPEISMWKLYPWGGLGATPLPRRYEAIWDSAKAVLSGGMPYSEGLYEDISKIQFIGYYWNKDARYTDILREYAAYEFGNDVADDAVRLMELIELNHVRVAQVQEPDFDAAEGAGELAFSIDGRMSEKRRRSWRWRILYIRAAIDARRYARYRQLGMHGEKDLHVLRHETEEEQILRDDPEAQALYQELRDIYHCLDHSNGKNMWTLPIVQGRMRI